MKKKNVFISYLILFVFAASLIFFGSRYAMRGSKVLTGEADSFAARYIVRVDLVIGTDVDTASFSDGTTMTLTENRFSGTVVFGERHGESIVAAQSYNNLTSGDTTPVSEGMYVFVYETQDGEYVVGGIIRLAAVALLALAFVILLMLFGRGKGVATLVSLALSVSAIFLVFVPAILSGHNIYLWTIMICIYTIIINPLFVGGFNTKSYASQLGCIGGVAIAGVLTVIMTDILYITGIVDDDSLFLSSMTDPVINMQAIVFSMVLIGALGSAIDVSMSIATSVWEMKNTAVDTGFAALFRSGINIGRDILGAQTGTLVLAYIGSSLSVVLLLVAYQSSVLELLNLEMIVIELLQTFVGGFTILFTIPATALFGAFMFSHSKNETFTDSNKRKQPESEKPELNDSIPIYKM